MENAFVLAKYFSNFLILLIRLGVILFLLPFWSGKQFPRLFKIGFILSMAYVLAPVIPMEIGKQEIPMIIIQELLLGATLGFAVKFVFMAVEFAGTMISDAMGISIASVFNPEMGRSTEISTILGLMAMLLFLALDLHHDLLAMIVKSYEVLPVGHLRIDHLLRKGISIGGEVFVLAIKIASPILVGMIIVNVLMGFIYKAAPQVNIFFVSIPVYVVIGLLILFLSTPLLFNFLGAQFSGLKGEINRILILGKGDSCAMAENQDKTEKATPRRRQKAREKGQVSRSRDLVSIANIGGILLVFYFGIKPFWERMSRTTASLLSLQFGQDPFVVFRLVTVETIIILLPFFLVILAASIGFNVIQGGLVFKPVQFEIKKVNPLAGFKNIYSVNGITEAIKSLIKFSVGVFLIYHFIKKSLEIFPYLMTLELWELTQVTGGLILRAFIYGFFFYLSLAVLDFFMQKKKFERSLRMSKQEIKEESKEIEGNPLIKSRVRSLQREMARRRMMAEVPKATVIITNPQHLAVALRYQEKELAAPQVVAKGAGLVAQKIKEVARQHGIPIVEDKPLARLLFPLDLNAFIPPDLYKAVAKIIAHLYKMKNRRAV